MPLISLSVQLKPYSFDLLATVMILYFSDRAIRSQNPWKTAWPLLLAAALLPGLSFASLLIIAGVIPVGSLLALARRHRYPLRLHAPYWLAIALVSATTYLLFFTAPHLSNEARTFMESFWQPAFPPRTILPFLRWLITIHTGNMFDYPAGGICAIPAMILSAIGAYRLLLRRPALFALLASPFATTFIAALFHQYPYGWKIRVSQQFAPSICIFAATGTAWCISLLPQVKNHWNPRRLATTFALLLLIGVAITTITIGFLWPYDRPEDQTARQIADHFSRTSPPTGTVLLIAPPEDLPRTFLWYIHLLPQLRQSNPLPPPTTPTLLVAITPHDDSTLQKTLDLYPHANRTHWTLPGRAPGTQVHITQLTSPSPPTP